MTTDYLRLICINKFRLTYRYSKFSVFILLKIKKKMYVPNIAIHSF